MLRAGYRKMVQVGKTLHLVWQLRSICSNDFFRALADQREWRFSELANRKQLPCCAATQGCLCNTTSARVQHNAHRGTVLQKIQISDTVLPALLSKNAVLNDTNLALPCSVVDRDCAVVHTDSEQGRVPLREVQASDAAVGAYRALRVLGVADLIAKCNARLACVQRMTAGDHQWFVCAGFNE